MSQPLLGEIRIFGGSFAPAGWAFCDGSLLSISEYDALFTLIGTTYGGDGEETFGLPDLRGRSAVHAGRGPGLSQDYVLGEQGGVEQVTLGTQQIPSHTHVPVATATPTSAAPSNSVVWSSQAATAYAPVDPAANLAGGAMLPAGGSQPHDNMPPYLVISYIIALYGVFPSPN